MGLAESIEGLGGQEESKDSPGGTFACTASGLQRSALARGNFLRDPKSKAVATASFGGEEGIEYVAEFVCRYARSGVGNGEDKAMLLSFPVARNVCAHEEASS